MSATVDRLDEMAMGNPPPWPVEFFYQMPGEAFAFVFGLCQAWPLLRREIHSLEAINAMLSDENDQFHDEHGRLAAQVNTLSAQLSTEREHNRNELANLRAQFTALTTTSDQLAAKVRDLPARVAAAEKVCASLGQVPTGFNPNMAQGCYDGAAFDQWKSLHNGVSQSHG